MVLAPPPPASHVPGPRIGASIPPPIPAGAPMRSLSRRECPGGVRAGGLRAPPAANSSAPGFAGPRAPALSASTTAAHATGDDRERSRPASTIARARHQHRAWRAADMHILSHGICFVREMKCGGYAHPSPTAPISFGRWRAPRICTSIPDGIYLVREMACVAKMHIHSPIPARRRRGDGHRPVNPHVDDVHPPSPTAAWARLPRAARARAPPRARGR